MAQYQPLTPPISPLLSRNWGLKAWNPGGFRALRLISHRKPLHFLTRILEFRALSRPPHPQSPQNRSHSSLGDLDYLVAVRVV